MQQVLVWLHSSNMHGWADDIIGYLASALVLATFSMKSLRSLRITAIASNVAFISYGITADMRPIFILHCILLPVNVVRLAQLGPSDNWLSGKKLSWTSRWYRRPPLQLPERH